MIERLFFTVVLIHCLSLKAGTAPADCLEEYVFRAPCSGKFVPVAHSKTLREGDLVGYMEVMKFRFPIYAPRDGVLLLPVNEGENGILEANSVIGTFSPQIPDIPAKKLKNASTAPNVSGFSRINIPQTDSPVTSITFPNLEKSSNSSELLSLEDKIIVLPNVRIFPPSKEEESTSSLTPLPNELRTDPFLQKEDPSPSLLFNLITGEDLEEFFKARKFSLDSLKSVIYEYFNINLLTSIMLVSLYYLSLLSFFIFIIRNPRQQKLKKI